MAIKCVLVDVDNVLITEVVEIMAELGEPDCKFINPYRFVDIDNMTPWIQASNQNEFMIRSEDILTIAEPTPEIIEKYKELTT
tara:strand:- start:305 stop:553 length:249 start_codon:yes stop_codon:yes gene_type:complete